jgi:hypothetical protein
MFKGLELSETRLANGRESSSNQLQNKTTSIPWVNRRRVRSTLSPESSTRAHGFLLVKFPNAGHHRAKTKTCAQARIEKP